MILFIGDFERQYYIDEPAAELGQEIVNTGSNPYHVEEIIEPALKDNYDHIVINLESMVDSAQTIYDVVNDVAHKTKANIVLMYIGCSLDSFGLSIFTRHGYTGVITSISVGEAKNQARRAFNELPSVARSESPSEDVYESDGQTRVIAFAGTAHRIGTTTQCLQAIGFLQSIGRSVAYVGMDGYREAISEFHKLAAVEPRFVYQDIEMYSNFNFETHYDYVVVDCGCIREKNFNRYQFKNADLRIIVAGSKPGEGETLALKLHNNYETTTVFSFVSDADVTGIRRKFEDTRVYFSAYIPDPFELMQSSIALYAQALKKNNMDKSTKERIAKLFKK